MDLRNGFRSSSDNDDDDDDILPRYFGVKIGLLEGVWMQSAAIP